MAQTIHILVADDHAIVRRGIKALINGKPDIKLVGEAENGEQAVAQARALKPDVILMDLLMPNMDGLEAIRAIRQENPHARILVLTSFADDAQVLAAIKAGAMGYLMKDSTPQELIEAIRCVARDEPSLHPAVARKLMLGFGQSRATPSGLSDLTERETEVLKLVARGLSNEAIGRELSISDGTVRVHVSNLLGKLCLESRTQAALYALREGLARLEDGA